MIKKIFCLLIIGTLFAATVPAQQQEVPTTKVYEVKYKPAEEIAKLLVGYNSAINPRELINIVPGSINATFNTFTVRAWPEGHAIVADIIQKYDVPKKTIEFQFFLIKANTAGEGLKDGVPEKVQKALKDVASLTRYKGFELIDAPFIRLEEGGGTATLDGKGIYSYNLRIIAPEIVFEENKGQISIHRFMVQFNVPAITSEGNPFSRQIRLDTPFRITEGEIVVLGASQIEREGKNSGAAIITIVTAEIL
jgi:hypothetical protein